MAGRAKATQWILDWLELGDVEQSDANIGDPIDIATKAGTALVALLALPGSQLVTLIVPEMNSNALIVFQVLIGVVTLGVINYVVTAKDSRTERGVLNSRTVSVYRYTRAERVIARLVIAIAVVLYSLNFIPAPTEKKNCDLLAKVKWQTNSSKKPLTLLLIAENMQTSYSLVSSSDVAITIPATSIPSYSFAVVWESGSRSDFDESSGCVPPMERVSKDGEATISLSSR
ncbi:hypothetical protein HFO06_28620 [Rhizobium leguminosarum]|uniref:hypothetical protein n=1 Tax=Rhizobium leguminosarum TaxID=384 RepID=UPI001C96A218|nr:hypothetical protein [Rhizobium leguminosarum]MBY5767016.1 hypothetical protein [Rhizobium leguminosarum]